MTSAELREAASHMRLLAKVEYAHQIGDIPELARLLAAVDPIECHALSAMLEVQAMVQNPPAVTPQDRRRNRRVFRHTY